MGFFPSMDDPIESRLLTDKAYYSAHFMDLALWEPSVRSICELHSFACKSVKAGIAGSFPTFMVELDDGGIQNDAGMIVVKFFGALYEGAASFGVELAIGHYLAGISLPIRSPEILASGKLPRGWQYLIFEGIPGVSIGQIRHQLTESSLLKVAGQMGVFMNQLHSGTTSGSPIPTKQGGGVDWSGFVNFLETQRESCHANHVGWGDLPHKLLEQVQDYLLPIDELLDFKSPPHLIHADLTGDHLLGELKPIQEITTSRVQPSQIERAEWETLAIIDWGDARVGNILYELVALHTNLFQADKSLLHTCLKNYNLSDFYKHDFPHKAMCMVLLHQFPMPVEIYGPNGDVQTLHELAARLFDI